MKRQGHLPTELARELKVSHTTVGRWLSGKDTPNLESCHRLAQYAGVSVERILVLAGHLPPKAAGRPSELPEFREYAEKKYPNELDDDLITMIEDLFERRKGRDNRGTELSRDLK